MCVGSYFSRVAGSFDIAIYLFSFINSHLILSFKLLRSYNIWLKRADLLVQTEMLHSNVSIMLIYFPMYRIVRFSKISKHKLQYF